jgi:hypothetical protein
MNEKPLYETVKIWNVQMGAEVSGVVGVPSVW